MESISNPLRTALVRAAMGAAHSGARGRLERRARSRQRQGHIQQ